MDSTRRSTSLEDLREGAAGDCPNAENTVEVIKDKATIEQSLCMASSFYFSFAKQLLDALRRRAPADVFARKVEMLPAFQTSSEKNNAESVG